MSIDSDSSPPTRRLRISNGDAINDLRSLTDEQLTALKEKYESAEPNTREHKTYLAAECVLRERSGASLGFVI